MLRKLIAVFLILLPLVSQAQLSVRLEGLANLSSAHVPYYLTNDLRYKPSIGGGLGAAFHYNYCDKDFIRVPLLFELRAAHTNQTLYDNSGNAVKNTNFRTSAFYLNVPIMYCHTFSEKITVGIGIENHFLLAGYTYAKGLDNFTNNPNSSSNSSYYRIHYFKPYNISIPVLLGYNFGRVMLYGTGDWGFNSRVKKSSDVKYKEKEWSVALGVSVKIGK